MEDNLTVDICLFETAEQFDLLLQSQKIHIVCVASAEKYSFCYKYLQHSVLFKQGISVDHTVNVINKNRDVASLYPAHYVSILPVLDYNLPDHLEKFNHLFNELIFNAHEQLIKTDRLVLMIDNSALDYVLLIRTLRLLFSAENKNKKRLKWLSRISIFQN